MKRAESQTFLTAYHAMFASCPRIDIVVFNCVAPAQGASTEISTKLQNFWDFDYSYQPDKTKTAHFNLISQTRRHAVRINSLVFLLVSVSGQGRLRQRGSAGHGRRTEQDAVRGGGTLQL